MSNVFCLAGGFPRASHNFGRLDPRRHGDDALAHDHDGRRQQAGKRQGQPMAMNNGGDTIDLVNPSGEVVHSVTYDHVDEGEEILPAR